MRGNSSSNILSKLTSPVAVKAAIAECDRMGRPAFLAQYGFRPSLDCTLHVDGAEYDSKAIAAVAFGFQHGARPLTPDECSGGRDRGNAGWALDRLGFRVAGIKHVGWWLDEVEPTVDAYFEMFALDRAGTPYKKSAYLKKLHERGPARTYKSYELKMQNISGVLHESGKEWLRGFAPKSEYQHLLRYVIEDRLGRPAELAGLESLEVSTEAHTPILRKIDWARRDAENRELGRGGERYVVEQERRRLTVGGRPDLAAGVTWEAEDADGHGYDISSFELDGTPIHIEVKTTTRDETTPFFVSSNEVRASDRLGPRYRLYRVFNFPSAPQIAKYEGPLSTCLTLAPTIYRARRR